MDNEKVAIQRVLDILESMFFSMPIPPEVVSKYNKLKEARFNSAGLQFTPITRSNKSFSKTKPIDEYSKNRDNEVYCIKLVELYTKLFETMFNVTIEKISMINDFCKNPTKSPYGYFDIYYR